MKPRLVQYDILKGIGILLVVVCHAGIGGIIKEVIYTFHMPLFFFASGCFFRDSKFVNYLFKNFKQLLIPYLLFASCMIIVRVCLNTYDTQSLGSSLLQAINSLSLLNESDPYLYESIWFLICLFFVRLIYWGVNRICNGSLLYKFILSLVLYLCGYILQISGVNIPLFIDSALTSVVFYNMGDIFHTKEWYTSTKTWLMFPICVALCVILCLKQDALVELKQNDYPLYLVVVAPIMIVSLYSFSNYISQYRSSILIALLKITGVSSLCILGFHNQLFLLIAPYLQYIPSFPHVGIFRLLLMTIVTVIIIIAIEKILTKYCPYVLGKF